MCTMHRRTYYELRDSQVTTPHPVVRLVWKLARKQRQNIDNVLDLGAGDGRFSRCGAFKTYTGIEIDRDRVREAKPPENGTIVQGCAFQHEHANYDLCIGNPPYVRHHDIESPWKERTLDRLGTALGFSLNGHCNLYLYFLSLAILKTRADGLISLVIPYEWVSRPSARNLREYLRHQKWNVNVYRFQQPIFEGVLTTASITIIDKNTKDGIWKYHEISSDYRVINRKGITASNNGVLQYSNRGPLWALRGLSPGSQEVFTLTEAERRHNGLSRLDVVPCVTTLRYIPRDLECLTRDSFEKYFVSSGYKCWLIRSYAKRLSSRLTGYLDSIKESDRNTYTCRNQTPWYNFTPHPTPALLVASGFTEFGPKVLINSVGARAVGSVYGVHSQRRIPVRRLRKYLLGIDFERQVVAHAASLKKIEVKQLNFVLKNFR
jgi:Eco57I restriction-modification methylase